MFFTEFLFAFLIAFILALALSAAVRKKTTMLDTLIIFIIIFFITWAGGVWFTPFGPPVFGVYLLPFIFIGVIIALLLMAATARPDKTTAAAAGEVREEQAVGLTLGISFWILLLLLIGSLVIYYLF